MSAHENVLCRSDLAVLDTTQLAVLNSLYSSASTYCDEYEWRWQRTPRSEVNDWLRMECGQRHIWLGVASATVSDNVDFLWRQFDGDAQRLAWCVSYPAVLQLAQEVFQQDWVPADMQAAPSADDRAIDAGFAIYQAEQRVALGRCRFVADEGPLPDAAVDGPLPSRLQGLAVAIPITVDRAVFSGDELRKLAIGSVVLVRRRAFLDIGAELRLRCGGNDLLVRVTGSKLTIVSIEIANSDLAPYLERDMTTKQDELAHADADSGDAIVGTPIDVASMPVEVRFEAGRIVTRYDELCRMRPGYTYELGHTLGEHAIDITANGALIARGELVNVGDQLGVRITSLGRDPRALG